MCLWCWSWDGRWNATPERCGGVVAGVLRMVEAREKKVTWHILNHTINLTSYKEPKSCECGTTVSHNPQSRSTRNIFYLPYCLQGNKIQATIFPHLVSRFAHLIKENYVYVIYYFRVVEHCNGDSFSPDKHRILFCFETVIVSSYNSSIDHYGLKFVSSNEILTRRAGFNCLVDAIGVLVFYQIDLEDPLSDGKTSVVKFELADWKGRFPCALSGKYVDKFREMMSKSSNLHPTVVLQFAKISSDRGYVCVVNLEEVTTVMFNPMTPIVSEFNRCVANAGGVSSLVNGNKVNSIVVSDFTPFDRLYPRKTVRELIETPESGFYVLCAKVVGTSEVKSWWYPVCRCGKFLEIGVRAYYCPNCNMYVFPVSNRFRLQMAIDDGTATAFIQMTDHPLRGIHALNLISLGTKFALRFYGKQAFNGKDVLLIVKKMTRTVYGFEDFVEIVNMTDDEGSVRRFHDLGRAFTPIKSISVPSVPQYHIEAVGDELISVVKPFVNNGKSVLIDTRPFSGSSTFCIGSSSNSNSNQARKELTGSGRNK
ncbi:uncharacterized protein LOC123908208 isoform X1 [Trifolium pratense]|uniref:uncharacterized protein LOC123908208 isoform X1 n=1 Tax=Trifolium pratense TaxID=57577 RepID=UPI001E694928|nr:uncharacterized protein LOC123908208 isoform X1 [Trifolium pratense]